jgi:hypothetical protein
MGLKANVPIGVAIEGIKLAQGWILTLVAPSKATILQVYLRKLTSLEGFTEALDASSIDIGLILISSPPNLVEVSKGKPTGAGRGFVSDKLRKEIFFSVITA